MMKNPFTIWKKMLSVMLQLYKPCKECIYLLLAISCKHMQSEKGGGRRRGKITTNGLHSTMWHSSLKKNKIPLVKKSGLPMFLFYPLSKQRDLLVGNRILLQLQVHVSCPHRRNIQKMGELPLPEQQYDPSNPLAGIHTYNFSDIVA